MEKGLLEVPARDESKFWKDMGSVLQASMLAQSRRVSQVVFYRDAYFKAQQRIYAYVGFAL